MRLARIIIANNVELDARFALNLHTKFCSAEVAQGLTIRIVKFDRGDDLRRVVWRRRRIDCRIVLDGVCRVCGRGRVVATAAAARRREGGEHRRA